MATSEQIVKVLQSRFPDVVNYLEDVPDTDHVTGFIISGAFDDLDHRGRQNLLWKTLEKEFSEVELENVGPIAVLTPADAELGAMSVE